MKDKKRHLKEEIVTITKEDCIKYINEQVRCVGINAEDALTSTKLPCWNDMTAEQFANSVDKEGGYGWCSVYATLKRMFE